MISQRKVKREKKRIDLIIYTHTNVCIEKGRKIRNIVVVLNGEIISLDWWHLG